MTRLSAVAAEVYQLNSLITSALADHSAYLTIRTPGSDSTPIPRRGRYSGRVRREGVDQWVVFEGTRQLSELIGVAASYLSTKFSTECRSRGWGPGKHGAFIITIRGRHACEIQVNSSHE
jgi:hypothetical protein